MNVLFASSESWPLIKTGGLGDVAYSLPHALHSLGEDVRLVLPAYRDVLKNITDFRIAGWLDLALGGTVFSARILLVRHDKFALPVYLVDIPSLFDREGGPYIHPDGYDWPDNAERFSVFSQAVAQLAMDQAGCGWKADIVHSNDWQTGLVSAYLDHEIERPRRVFTIHNMAYGGHFSHDEFIRQQLPAHWWSSEGVEFYGNFSMLKAGMIYSDAITTVSPTYAEEICTPAFGYGLEGVLASRRYKLSGILNGIDTTVWDPENDPFIPCHFSESRRNPGKKCNKKALLERFSLASDDAAIEAPLLGMVSRLVEQKGVDMVIDAIPVMLEQSDANFVLVGQGHPHLEAQLVRLQQLYPDRVAVMIGYSEELAHLVEAGSDLFLMPSRFEPCGLNQMYSLRYGTLPVVHQTGGLADTVRDEENGFVFSPAVTHELIATLQRALSVYTNKRFWHALQRHAMQQDYGWKNSARQYRQLYSNDV